MIGYEVAPGSSTVRKVRSGLGVTWVAAAAQVTPGADLTFLTVDEPGATSYPITYQSWDLVYSVQPTANDAALLKAYLGYLLGSSGQALLAPLNLAPLPASIDQMAVAQLSQITS